MLRAEGAPVAGFCSTWLAVGAQYGLPLENLAQAVQTVLARLYFALTPPTAAELVKARNELIRQRYAAGETLRELSQAFGLSHQRIHQIIHGRRK